MINYGAPFGDILSFEIYEELKMSLEHLRLKYSRITPLRIKKQEAVLQSVKEDLQSEINYLWKTIEKFEADLLKKIRSTDGLIENDWIFKCLPEVLLFYQKLFDVPDKMDLYHDKWVLPQVRRNVEATSERIQEIVNAISDEDIIHTKGELPECVVMKEDGTFDKKNGMILEKKYYYASLVSFVEEIAGESLEGVSLVDVGATDDLLFRFIDKKGVGVNVSQSAVDNMKSKGIESVLVASERLPFDDNSFDYGVCFNTLPHIENPILSLKELKRVCRKNIFIAQGNPDTFDFFDYKNEKLGRHRWGKFRWPREQFIRLLDYIDLPLENERAIRCLATPESYKEEVFQKIWGGGRTYHAYVVAT